jgi:hypothetical protein
MIIQRRNEIMPDFLLLLLLPSRVSNIVGYLSHEASFVFEGSNMCVYAFMHTYMYVCMYMYSCMRLYMYICNVCYPSPA